MNSVKQIWQRHNTAIGIALSAVLGISLPLAAAILPEDRGDFLYHSYEGGGLSVNGPSLSLSKQLGKYFSLSAKHYEDSISSATVDVMSYGSPYTEHRKEQDYSMTFLKDKTTASAVYVNSEESDYSAGSYHISLSQDMFGDLTTVSLGYSRGFDEVRRNLRDGFGNIIGSDVQGNVDRYQYRLGVTQILTKNMIFSLNYEAISDEGYLNNPYRNAFYWDPTDLNHTPPPLATTEPYPETHTSVAISGRVQYYLPWKASLKAELRSYGDSWSIKGTMTDLGYSQKLFDDWIMDVHFRHYSQTAASFYSDVFDENFNYMGRDKELATYTTTTVGAKLSYNFLSHGWNFIDKASMNLSYDRIQFDYADFYDRSLPDGGMNWGADAPLYRFSADVITFYVSVWY